MWRWVANQLAVAAVTVCSLNKFGPYSPNKGSNCPTDILKCMKAVMIQLLAQTMKLSLLLPS